MTAAVLLASLPVTPSGAASPEAASATAGTAVGAGGAWFVVRSTKDACGKGNVLRRGRFEDGRGWGYRKMVLKHNLRKVLVWRDTVRTRCGNQEGESTTWIYRAHFDRLRCSSQGCVGVDTRVVRTVEQRRKFDGKRKGNISAYCEGSVLCPPWINKYQGLSIKSVASKTAGSHTVIATP